MSGFKFYKSEYIEFVSVSDTKLEFSEHSHSADFVVTILTNGEAVLHKNGVNTVIRAGNSFVILPYENHALFSEMPISMITMCIKKNAVYSLTSDDYKRILREADEKSSLDSIYKSIFSEYAFDIYSTYHDTQEDSDLISITRDRIETNPESNAEIGEAAASAYTSKYHYIRKFRSVSGLTPHKFRIQSRIRKAQELLINGQSISDTAQEMGFYDQSHFDRYFKKIVGISPEEYIRSFSNFLQD